MIEKLRLAWRLFLFGIFFTSFVGTASFVGALSLGLAQKRKNAARINRRFGQLALRLLNLRVKVKNLPSNDKNYLFVGNHLGFLDVLILAATTETLFITSVEMQRAPLLGILCKLAGCLFVERRMRSQIPVEVAQIRTVLQSGVSVALYPEGTSHDGQKVLPFKGAFLVSTAGIDVPILPAVLNFRKINGELMSDRWRDFVFWYGDQQFFPALLRILSLRSIEVELEFLEEVIVASPNQRREIATQLHAQISSRFSTIPRPQ